MCGIFGLVIPQKQNVTPKTIVRSIDMLFRLSESRGKEASGVAVSMNAHTHVLKMPQRSTMLIASRQYHNIMEKIELLSPQDYPLTIIGHSRLTTHGTEGINRNNQPIIGTRAIIIHNGIILNTASLWKKYASLKKHTDVDTEIILALFEKFRSNMPPEQALVKTYHDIQGEASVAILETGFPYLSLASNAGSLYYLIGDNVFIFASEKYILEQLRKKAPPCSLPRQPKIVHVRAGTGTVINIRDLSRTNIRLDNHQSCLTPSAKPYSRPVVEHAYAKNMYAASNMYRNSLTKLQRHVPDFDAISHIRRCTRCIMPETMPLIRFDENGVCNFCRTYKKQARAGTPALRRFIEPFLSKTDAPDCIVALSGGRDSSYGLHYVKNVLKLNPIAYTYDWGMVTDIARRNQSRMSSALGVEHVVVSADIKKKLDNIRNNLEAWLAKPDLGMVTLLMAGDKQAEYYVEELKRKTGIPLVIYCRGNQLEDERFKFGYFGIFDGTPGGVIHNLSAKGKLMMLTYYGKQFLNNPKYVNSSLVDSAWAYASAYLVPHAFLYLWNYIPWDEKTVVSTLRKQYGWESPPDTVATWRIDDGTPPFYNYIYYKIQGFTENDGLRSNQIREGVITRKRALALITQENKPRYEALLWYFDRLGINGDKVLTRIDGIPALYRTE